MDRRAMIQRRIANEVARFDFARRAVELRRLNKTYEEIASQMGSERGEPVSVSRVRREVLAQLRNVDAIDDVRYAELDKLESMAATLRQKLVDMDELDATQIDLELYDKIATTYLKYRERIAKLVGLDAPVRQKIERDDSGALGNRTGQAIDGGSVTIDKDGTVHVKMPGSVAAYEEWAELSEVGMVQLAGEVLELNAGDHEEVIPPGLHNDAAGVTLRPDVDVTPGAERNPPMSALEALDLLEAEESP